uniref:Uncharacterized protein n=1 Tax=Anguilla anguilla TaxID=7936 RepID=A0A0E9V5F1_ANGAN
MMPCQASELPLQPCLVCPTASSDLAVLIAKSRGRAFGGKHLLCEMWKRCWYLRGPRTEP